MTTRIQENIHRARLARQKDAEEEAARQARIYAAAQKLVEDATERLVLEKIVNVERLWQQIIDSTAPDICDGIYHIPFSRTPYPVDAEALRAPEAVLQEAYRIIELTDGVYLSGNFLRLSP